jgi:hypothetical protein
MNRTVIVVSADKHSGSTMGLMPSAPYELHDGGTYTPSPLQKILWQQYDECLDFVKEQRKKSRLIWIENGDVCEGIHHQSTQLVCPRVETHENIASEIFDYTFKKLKFSGDDLAFMVAGTEAHASSGNQSENRVANDIECFTPQFTESSGKPTRFVWDKLLFNVNGVGFDITHHGSSVGGRAWTTENGMYNRVKSFYFETLNDIHSGVERELPRYWVRSHLHQFVQATYDGQCGSITGIVTPSFQFKTGFGKKVAGDRLSDIGLIVFVVEADGSHKMIPLMARYKQDKAMVL